MSNLVLWVPVSVDLRDQNKYIFSHISSKYDKKKTFLTFHYKKDHFSDLLNELGQKIRLYKYILQAWYIMGQWTLAIIRTDMSLWS